MKKGIYQHYKGNQYDVSGIARHSETLENMVVYQQLYGDFGWWVRPHEMFLEEVEIASIKQPRFKLIENDTPTTKTS